MHVAPVSRVRVASRPRAVAVKAARAPLELPSINEMERFRLTNVRPAPGSRRPAKRKGRGYGAGQGATCGFGMRGQKSRSGPGVRPGFEGGQIPLYRRLPKLRGIAGGMSAGLPKNVTVNVGVLASAFKEGDEVTLDALKQRNILNVSGRERKLGLKVLGDGELPFSLKVTAETFSASAKAKIEAAGGSVELTPRKKKWLPKNKRADKYREAPEGEAAEEAKEE